MSRLGPRTLDALAVAAIVLLAAIAAAIFSLQLVQYVVMPDELTYVKQATEFAHGNVLLPGDHWFSSWALLRPMTMAPFVRWLGPGAAFDAIHVTGGLIMASAAWPAYLLSMRANPWRAGALIVAAMTVAIPWLAMSGTFMLEVIAYPAFIWAALAMTHAIARPSLRADLLFVLAIAIAFLARTELGVLAPAFVLAVIADALLRRDGRSSARARLVEAARHHWLLLAAAMLATLLVFATGSETRLLGSYTEPTKGSLLPAGTGHAMHELTAYIVVGIGALPLAGTLAWLATTLGRPVRRDAHALAAVTIAVVVAVAFTAATFTVRFTEGINDRYIFYIAPLLIVGFVAFLAERPRHWLPAFAISGALVVVLIWTSDLAQAGPSLVSPSMSFHQWLNDRAAELGGSLTGPHLAAIGTAVLVLIVLLVAWRTRGRVPAVVAGTLLLAFTVAETAYTFNQIAATQKGANARFFAERSWIDAKLPYGARAAAVLAQFGDPKQTAAVWWDTGFWNETFRASFRMPGTSDFEQGVAPQLYIDPTTGRVPGLDPYDYVIRSGGDSRFGLRGSKTVASSGALLVLTAARPYQADWLFEGPDLNNTAVPAGKTGTLRVFGTPSSRGATVVVGTGSPDSPPARFVIRSGSETRAGSVAPGRRTTVRVPARFVAPGVATLSLRSKAGVVQLLEAAAQA